MKPIKKYDVQEDDDNSFVKTSGRQQQPHDFEKNIFSPLRYER